MNKHFKIAGLVLALGSFAAAAPLANPAAGQSQQQNRNTAVQITQEPRVEHADGNSASIAWTTNVQAGTRVKYGTNPNNLSQSATAPWGALTHRVELKNLQPNTTYYFQAISENASGSGTSATSSVSQFRTNPNGQQGYNQGQYNNQYGQNDRDHDRDHDRDADDRRYSNNDDRRYSNGPDNVVIVAGPVVQNLNPNRATLWWQTNNTAANDVFYGTDPNHMDQRAYERGGSKDHTADLDNLQPGRVYYYQIRRRDGSIRTTGQFATPGGYYGSNRNGNYGSYPNTPQQGGYPPPQGGYQNGGYPGQMITRGPIIETLGPNNATIAWTTNTQASSIVRYGTNPNALTQTAQGPWSAATHRVVLNNLQPNTRYYFDVISTQAPQRGGGVASSNTGQFQTLNAGQSAMNVSQQY
jgi:hypothetical protein